MVALENFKQATVLIIKSGPLRNRLKIVIIKKNKPTEPSSVINGITPEEIDLSSQTDNQWGRNRLALTRSSFLSRYHQA